MIMRVIKSLAVAIFSAVSIAWIMYTTVLLPMPAMWLNLVFVTGGIISVLMYLWCFLVVFGLNKT